MVDLLISLRVLWVPFSYKFTKSVEKTVGTFKSDNDVNRGERWIIIHFTTGYSDEDW